MDQLLDIVSKDDFNELVVGLRLSSNNDGGILALVRSRLDSESFDEELNQILFNVLNYSDSLEAIRKRLLLELYRHHRLDFDTVVILLKSGLRFNLNDFLSCVSDPDRGPDVVVFKHSPVTVFPLLSNSFLDFNEGLLNTLL